MIGCDTVNHELSIVDCSMMQITGGSEVAQLVATAVALKLDVVEIEADVATTSRHGAAVAIACEHLLPLASGDRGGNSLRGGGIERAEVDGIACGALDHHRIDFDVSTTAALPGPFTIGALLDRNLVSG